MITQTDPNVAYDEKCRKIAEMIAKDTLQDQWERMSAESNEYRIERKMPIARAIVAEMEKEAKEAYFTCAQDHGAFATYSDPDLKNHLIERGLIPNIKTDDNA